MITCKTPAAKKILANHLSEHDRGMMEFLTAFGEEFGPLESVSYEGPGQEKLKAKLTAMRDTKAEAALNGAREILK